ncbi:MAG: TIGR02996 domain-containing protein, partial [Gemmataceae bacterium]|nr:TIGR02996 domain-containing protein [Gemmataceae bacterium]
MQAIIAQPEEDTPRLVYADWLQENGQPERAEYIRLSIEMANLRYGITDDEQRYWQLRAARDPLVERHYKVWERAFASRFPPNRDVLFGLDRGFVERIHCSVKYLLDHADALFREATLRTFSPHALSASTARRLVGSPHFARLRRLQTIRFDNAAVLLECDAVPLQTLDFSQPVVSSRYWDRVAEVAAGHAGLGSVRYLSFENCGLGNLAGACLADARHLEPDVLNLIGHNISEERVKDALRARYGKRVWLDEADRAGVPRRMCG